MRLLRGFVQVTGIVSSGLNLRCPETGELSHLPTMHLSDWPHLCLPLLKMHQSSLERALRQGDGILYAALEGCRTVPPYCDKVPPMHLHMYVYMYCVCIPLDYKD